MVYKFCNAESAIATCDSYACDKPKPIPKLRRFAYAELEAATDCFSPNTLLGRGSHGTVHKAILDGGSLVVAVKRPTSASNQTPRIEIDILRRIRSRRIVNLIGYTVPAQSKTTNTNTNKLLLVVEYMPNGSLYDLIHTNPNPPRWGDRVRIALQIAEAVRTLHLSDPPIIHRDIKSTNVLIDRKRNARLSDFGLALRGQVEDMRLMSTPPAGTLGYLDPCYLAPADVSAKSDVFSFGILLLEIISGRRAIDVNYSPPGIVEWALPLIKSDNYSGICDRRIKGNVDRTAMKELALLAVRCVRSTAEKRPPITQVVDGLKTVYKKMQIIPMWDHLKRHARRVERSQRFNEIKDSGREFPPAASKHGRSTRTGKVSNVASPPGDGEMVERVQQWPVRYKSKSVGPEMVSSEKGGNHMVKRKGEVTVKLCGLSKSRSMSVLQSKSSQNWSYRSKSGEMKVLDEFPLLVVSSSPTAYTIPKFVT